MQQQNTDQVGQRHHSHRNARKRPNNGCIGERSKEKTDNIDDMEQADISYTPQIGHCPIAIVRPSDRCAESEKQQ